MKKIQITSAILASVVVASSAQAGKNTREPLADIVAGGCSFEQIAPYGTSLLASWDWENGEGQTKFGGDAKFLVEASIDEGANWQKLEIEFELEQYEPGTSPDDYAGTMVYRCSNAITEADGSCNGSVLGVRDALLNAAAEALSVDPDVIGENLTADLDGVMVKVMNPGKGNGRQNYELVDVCNTPI